MADAGEAAAHTASASGHGLGKKLGPLPIWAWAAVVVGTYLLYHYLKNRSASAGSTPTGTVAGGNNAPLGGLQVGPAGQIYDPTTGTIVGSTNPPAGTGATDTTTVQGWLAAAQSALQGLGLDNNAINGALNDYVAGNQLPQGEFNIVEEAIKVVGTAPSSLGNPALAPPTPNPAPAPSPAPSPAATLPPINAQLYPLKVLFGQYSPGDYTKIGNYSNGQYSGYNVSGGAPVYLNVFGGFVQDFNTATANGDVYIPTSLLPYVVGYPGNTSSSHYVSHPGGTSTRAAVAA